MKVACVFKTGGDFRPDHVRALREQVRIHFPQGTEFLCLTNSKAQFDDTTVIPLQDSEKKGWWSKIELFRSDIADGDAVLYMDLDTWVVGNPAKVTAMVEMLQPGQFAIVRDFYHPNHIQSCVMAWRWSDFFHGIYEYYNDVPKTRKGDQKMIEDYFGQQGYQPVLIQDHVPNEVVSYKVHCRDHFNKHKQLPHDACIVCFHGRPRPWEVEPVPILDPTRIVRQNAGNGLQFITSANPQAIKDFLRKIDTKPIHRSSWKLALLLQMNDSDPNGVKDRLPLNADDLIDNGCGVDWQNECGVVADTRLLQVWPWLVAKYPNATWTVINSDTTYDFWRGIPRHHWSDGEANTVAAYYLIQAQRLKDAVHPMEVSDGKSDRS